jgi:hypothetical protein
VIGPAASAARLAAAGLVLVAVLASAATARAQATAVRSPADKKIVGILEVRVDGVSPTVAERFEAAIEEGLSSAELWIATRTRLREMLAGSTWSEGCLFGPCLAEVRRQTEVDRVVIAYFQGRGSSYRFVVSLVDTGTGRVRAQAAERCEVCTLSEALDAAVLATIGLVHEAVPGSFDGPGDAPPPRPRRVKATPGDRTQARRAALLVVGVGALAGGAGLYFASRDRDAVGYAALGGSGGLIAAGAVMFGLSFSLD